MARPNRNRIGVGLDLEGLPVLKEALEGVKVGVRNQVVRGVVRNLASAANKRAKSGQKRKRTGQLRKSLGLRPRSYRRKVYVVVVGPRRGFEVRGPNGERVDPAKYAHLVERGRKANRPTRGRVMTFVVGRGRKAGRVFTRFVKAFRGDPFMGPAAEYVKLIAPNLLSTQVPPALEKVVARYAAKGKSVMAGE